MRTILVMAALTALAGCSSYEDRVAATCSRLGAPPGSENYWSCVQMQQANDAQTRGMWMGMSQYGFGMAQPRPQPATNTSCSTSLGVTNCHSW